MTTLTKMEAMLLQGAEECRKRALDAIDQAGDPVIIAQDLADAAKSYEEAANEIALRARRAAVAAAKEARHG